MNYDQFAQYARFPTGESLRLDEVTVRVGDKTFDMSGSLRIVEGEFLLDLIQQIEDPQGKLRSFIERMIQRWFPRLLTMIDRIIGKNSDELPHIGGFIGASQFWYISGVIENSIRFRCRAVPSSHTVSVGEISTKSARFEVSRISLGSDRMTQEQTSNLLRRLNTLKAKREERTSDSPSSEDEALGGIVYEFRAVIPGIRPLWKTSFTETIKTNEYLGSTTKTERDTLIGQAPDVEFALIEADQDLEVHMRYRAGQNVSEAGARARFDTLLQAIAFTHGCEPWCQRYEVRRGIQRIEDSVTARQDIPVTSYNLLSQRACSNGADLVSAIILVMDFFTQKTDTTQRIEALLHIARQAGAANVPFDLGTLGLCTVFEGVIDALFDEAKLNRSTIEKSSDLQAFEMARQESLNWLATKPDDAGHRRLRSVIQTVGTVRNREKAIVLAEHFGLDWNSVLKPAFDAWGAERNPRAHGSYRQENDESVILSRFRNKSRIAGAINLLIAKRIDYKGLAIRSPLEEEFIRL